MGFVEILLIGIGLSMDAFSVSICKGLTTKKFSIKMALLQKTIKTRLRFVVWRFPSFDAAYRLLFGRSVREPHRLIRPLDCLWPFGFNRHKHDSRSGFKERGRK